MREYIWRQLSSYNAIISSRFFKILTYQMLEFLLICRISQINVKCQSVHDLCINKCYSTYMPIFQQISICKIHPFREQSVIDE